MFKRFFVFTSGVARYLVPAACLVFLSSSPLGMLAEEQHSHASHIVNWHKNVSCDAFGGGNQEQ